MDFREYWGHLKPIIEQVGTLEDKLINDGVFNRATEIIDVSEIIAKRIIEKMYASQLASGSAGRMNENERGALTSGLYSQTTADFLVNPIGEFEDGIIGKNYKNMKDYLSSFQFRKEWEEEFKKSRNIVNQGKYIIPYLGVIKTIFSKSDSKISAVNQLIEIDSGSKKKFYSEIYTQLQENRKNTINKQLQAEGIYNSQIDQGVVKCNFSFYDGNPILDVACSSADFKEIYHILSGHFLHKIGINTDDKGYHWYREDNFKAGKSDLVLGEKTQEDIMLLLNEALFIAMAIGEPVPYYHPGKFFDLSKQKPRIGLTPPELIMEAEPFFNKNNEIYLYLSLDKSSRARMTYKNDNFMLNILTPVEQQYFSLIDKLANIEK